ncbi:hypothetical protein ACP275_13G045300 [Erythranthe tilingii]
MIPLKLFTLSWRKLSLWSWAIDSGISPLKPQDDKESVVRDVRFPINCGICPENSLLLNPRAASFSRFSSSPSMVPERLLSIKFR